MDLSVLLPCSKEPATVATLSLASLSQFHLVNNLQFY
jgi:hypothetical protein